MQRLVERGGLEELPAASAAIQKAQQDLATLQGQRNRLRPEALAAEESAITTKAIETVVTLYERAQTEQLKAEEHKRGRVITETMGVDVVPQTPEARRALEAQWAQEIPALLGALPYIDDVAELEDLADVVFVREHGTAIRCLTPALAKRLGELSDPKAKTAWLRLQGRFRDWRNAHPTHQARVAAMDAREAAIKSGMTRSRDMLLKAHGLKRTPLFRG